MDAETINFSPINQTIDKFVNITGIPDSLVDAAKARLIQLLKEQFPDFDIDPSQFDLVKFNHLIWPDSSIGCPQDGHFYTQVQTPGYSMEFKIGCTVYTMHIDASGSLIASPDFPNQR